jgi:hypothetical protein
MMKKLLNYFLTIGFIGITSSQVFAQTTNVSAVWSPLNGANAAGSVNTPTSSAGVTAAMEFGGTMRIWSSANQNTGSAVSDGLSTWQRISMPHPSNPNGLSLPWTLTVDQNGVYDPTQYFEFNISADAGKWLQINSISMPMIAFGTGDARMVARYSVDGAADANFRFFYKKGVYFVKTSDTAGLPDSVAVTAISPLAPKRNNTTDGGTTTLSAVTLTFNNLQINVAPGKTFRVRFYPYMRGGSEPSSTGSRGIQIREAITLAGQTSDNALATDEPTLPLDFLSFTAKASALGNAVNLNWKTTNEVNTKNFEVQSRTNNSEFKTIGFVESRNTAGVHNYAFTDNNPAASTVYYRLKQVDNDGKYEYSDIESVSIKQGASLAVYPNPVSEVLSVKHSASANRISIINLEGKKLLEKAVSNDAISTDINVMSLSTGTYFIVVEGKEGKSSIKFVKK